MYKKVFGTAIGRDLVGSANCVPRMGSESSALSFLFRLVYAASSIIGTTHAYPVVHLRKLEFPQPPNTMRRQPSMLTPAVNSVPGHTQVLRDLIDGNPWFCSHNGHAYLLKAFQVAKTGSKSNSALSSPPMACVAYPLEARRWRMWRQRRD